MLNPYSEDERLQAMISACYRASRSHFNHIAIRDIIAPPREMFDAKLARQIAIHILNVEFSIPRRRLVMILTVARTTILGAVRTVGERMHDPVFERAYQRISARAKDLFMAELHDAARRDEEAA